MSEKGKEKKEHITLRTLAFMLKTVWRERPSMFLLYLYTLISDFITRMLNIIMPKFIIDEIVLIIGGEPLEEHLPNAVLYTAVMLGVGMLINLLDNACSQFLELADEWFQEYIDVQISDHAMKMDFEHTEDPEALDALNKAKEGMSWYSGGVKGIIEAANTIIINGSLLCGVVTLIIMTCPLLLPVQLVSLVCITIFNAKKNKAETEYFLRLAKTNRIFGYLFYQLSQFRYGKDIRLYDSAKMMCKKTEKFSNESIDNFREQSQNERRYQWVMDVINSLRDGLSYFYIGYLAVIKAITIGDFSMCVSSASTFYWSLSNIVTGLQDIKKKCRYAHRYLLFLEYPAAMPKGNRSVKQGEHTIEFSHVSFKYPRSEKYVLRDINITIRSGEHLSVVGLNGAGKTTFIKLLCRLYDVTEGAILIDGVNIKEYSDDEYRKLFAVVFQDFCLFAFSLRENIALSNEADDERINEVLEQSGLYNDAQKLEHGLDTMLSKSFDENGTELSGGQQQKTAISRALYRNAPIVILDEPTAALDPVAEYEIYRRFNSLVGGKTAIYISHRLSSCKFCDRIAVFAEDTIKEYGTHDELAAKTGGIYAEMFLAQAQYYVDTNG